MNEPIGGGEQGVGSGRRSAVSTRGAGFKALPPLAVFLLYALLALVTTHPLWLHLTNAVPGDIGDPLLNTWILAWDAHATLTGPLHLFNTNIYFPLPNTLAYSEHLFSTAALILPLGMASGGPVLAYNLSLLLSFPLAGLGMYLLVLSWTHRRGAAFVAGLAFAFAPYRLAAVAHLQLLTVQWLPFSLLALGRLLKWQMANDKWQISNLKSQISKCWFLLVVFTTLQVLASWYLAVFTALILGLYLLGWLLAGRKKEHQPPPRLPHAPRSTPHVSRFTFYVSRFTLHASRSTLRLALAALAVAALTLPFALPYLKVLPELQAARPASVAASFAARPADFLAAPSFLRVAGPLTRALRERPGFTEENTLFLGVIAPLLALVGLALSRPRWRAITLGAMLVGSLALTFAGPYLALTRLTPALTVVRVPPRWIIPATFALAALAGLGMAGGGDQGVRDRGSGSQGSGSQGSREQGAGKRGSGDQGIRDQGSGDQGIRDQGSGNQGRVPPGTAFPASPLPASPSPASPSPASPLPDSPSPASPLPDSRSPDSPIPDSPLPDSRSPDSPIPDSLIPDFLIPLVTSLLLIVESFAAPLPLAAVGDGVDVSPVYYALQGEALHGADEWAVVELPMHVAPAPEYPETKRMLASTLGWWGLVNGYSGFTPARQVALGQALAGFPDETSLAALRNLAADGVRYLIVHPGEEPMDRATWETVARWQAERGTSLLPAGRFGPDDLYRINPYADDLITNPAAVSDPYWSAQAPTPVNVRFTEPTSGADIRLLAYSQSTNLPIYQSSNLPIFQPSNHPPPTRLTLYWQASAPLETGYTVFLHSLNAEGKLVDQADGPPLAEHYPTNAWRPGEIVQDSRLVPPGERYLVGLYDPGSGERLPAFAADGSRLADDAVILVPTNP